MSRATSIYQELIPNMHVGADMQAYIDNSQVALFGRTLWRKYLTWGVKKGELSFETVVGKSRNPAAASIVDKNSPAPLRSRPGISFVSGKIPTMKEKFAMDQDDYRAIQNLRNYMSGVELEDEIARLLQNDVQEVSLSTDLRLDYMFLQGISTLTIDVSVLNNPDGAVFGTIPLLQPDDMASHLLPVVKVWSDATSDPIQDIRNVVQSASNTKGLVFDSIWMDNAKWFQLSQNAALKAYISGYNNPGSNAKFVVTLDRVNEFLGANRLPTINLLDQVIGIESIATQADKAAPIKYQRPFEANNVVFMPAGRLGTVHNAYVIEEAAPVAGKTYAKYDRALIKKWRDDDPWREYTEIELNAFPGIEAADNIYVLKTNVAA
ncbi:hypothetical protein AHMF7605_11820 [Adhaeribacter arboris]|uniref:Major capsid protein E n=1 Tax=Adhaeribacter arboris TaxID=2072846 RepID=A0A2T2YF69_9BACT|nr:major capsid protein [Adhaeribacter arboris]PSR54159.1 hypothetical protein AHMF7605_11820 [Adhaeribacter arboris]